MVPFRVVGWMIICAEASVLVLREDDLSVHGCAQFGRVEEE